MKSGTVRFEVQPNGQGTVLLDGVDITNSLSGMNIRVRAGRPTRVLFVTTPLSAGGVAEQALLGIADAQHGKRT